MEEKKEKMASDVYRNRNTSGATVPRTTKTTDKIIRFAGIEIHKNTEFSILYRILGTTDPTRWWCPVITPYDVTTQSIIVIIIGSATRRIRNVNLLSFPLTRYSYR